MANAKYIILDTVHTQFGESFNVPIIFPDCLTHTDVANNYGGKDNVVSAGFVQISSDSDGMNTYHAYGDSISLGKKSEENDSYIIRRVFEDY